jgi:hypothetical protein
MAHEMHDTCLQGGVRKGQVGTVQDLLCTGHEAIAIIRAGEGASTKLHALYLEMVEHNAWAD